MVRVDELAECRFIPVEEAIDECSLLLRRGGLLVEPPYFPVLQEAMVDEVPVFVFAKPPVAGVSKTRLARGVGPEQAVRLARAFLDDVIWGLSMTKGLAPVISTTDMEFDFGWDVERVHQGDGDLGSRLERTLAAGVASSGRALAVGADSPGLPESMLYTLLEALDQYDASFISSVDGGFVAMGIRTVPAGLFADLPWSAPDTLDAVEGQMRERGLSSIRVGEWFDIDEASDLKRFRTRVPLERAPHTWAVLTS